MERPNSLPMADGREKADCSCLREVVARKLEVRVAVESTRRKNTLSCSAFLQG